jgi:hypothetical protein
LDNFTYSRYGGFGHFESEVMWLSGI